MGTRRVIDWRIEPGENDTYTLHLHNRMVLRDTSRTEIDKYLRKHRRSGQRVHEVADDGYITDLTRRVERRQPAERTEPKPRTKRRGPVRMPLVRF